MSEFIRYLTSTLTVVTFFPLVGVIALLLIKKEFTDLIRWVAVSTSLITFALSLLLLLQFDPSNPNMQLVVLADWISVGSRWRIQYHLGVDGLSIMLVLLTYLSNTYCNIQLIGPP